jgi:hypothetical protein
MKINQRFVVLLSLMFVFVSVSSVAAIEYGGFGGRPAYPRPDNPRTESIFIHTLEPGSVKDDGLLVINNSEEKKTVIIYAADYTPSTGGSFACKQFDEAKTDVGSWIVLEKTEVTLEPQTKELVPFKITVPENADTGEHNGCILIQEKKEKVEGGSGANLAVRTGLRVAITIPGEIVRNIEITSFEIENKDGIFVLKPSIKNNGNVSVDTNIKLITNYFFGSKLIQHGGQYPVLRGETSSWNFEIKQPFWGGWYRSTLIAEYDASTNAEVGANTNNPLVKIETKPIRFFSYPTPAGLATEIFILLTIAFIIYSVIISQKRNKWIKDNWVKHEIKSEDNINSLANQFKVSWKLLVKVNKLKPPYILKKGEKISVPPIN